MNFWAAFKAMERNEVFGTSTCLIKTQKSQPLHVIMVEQFIKKPVLFRWWKGATFHWVVVGYKFNIINI